LRAAFFGPEKRTTTPPVVEAAPAMIVPAVGIAAAENVPAESQQPLQEPLLTPPSQAPPLAQSNRIILPPAQHPSDGDHALIAVAVAAGQTLQTLVTTIPLDDLHTWRVLLEPAVQRVQAYTHTILLNLSNKMGLKSEQKAFVAPAEVVAPAATTPAAVVAPAPGTPTKTETGFTLPERVKRLPIPLPASFENENQEVLQSFCFLN